VTRGDWLTVQEAAALVGYSVDYFRRTYCGEPPLLFIRTKSHGRRRRILVSRKSVQSLIDSEVRQPNGRSQCALSNTESGISSTEQG